MDLIKRCLDANPLNRPTAYEIFDILSGWYWILEYNYTDEPGLKGQIKEADETNNNSSTTSSKSPSTSLGISYETHSEAIYTSRLLDFNNLPEPKNSEDYYKQNDNIITKEFSGNCQFFKYFLIHRY